MQTTSDNDGITLIEEASGQVLRKAYFNLGRLHWGEQALQRALNAHSKKQSDKVWKSQLEESNTRVRRIMSISRQINDILKKRKETASSVLSN